MAKYKITNSAVMIDGKRYVRGDIVETDLDLGVRAEPYIEPATIVVEDDKPKRKRTVKAKVQLEG